MQSAYGITLTHTWHITSVFGFVKLWMRLGSCLDMKAHRPMERNHFFSCQPCSFHTMLSFHDKENESDVRFNLFKCRMVAMINLRYLKAIILPFRYANEKTQSTEARQWNESSDYIQKMISWRLPVWVLDRAAPIPKWFDGVFSIPTIIFYFASLLFDAYNKQVNAS